MPLAAMQQTKAEGTTQIARPPICELHAPTAIMANRRSGPVSGCSQPSAEPAWACADTQLNARGDSTNAWHRKWTHRDIGRFMSLPFPRNTLLIAAATL